MGGSSQYYRQARNSQSAMERVQKFGLRMCYKHWDLSYDDESAQLQNGTSVCLSQ